MHSTECESLGGGFHVIQPAAAMNAAKLNDAGASDGGGVGLSKNALTVLENRYLNRDDDGKVIETPAQLFRRVAHAVAAIESKWGLSAEAIQEVEDAFYRTMTERLFMPNSPTLMNAGRRLGMLSACFVLPLNDSIPDIMETARQIALVQRAGGGTGVDLSQLRPKGAIVKSSGGTTDGPLSFLKMLSAVTDAIQQGAFRRGANMGMMRIDHPDIVSFVDLKGDLTKVTNYNLSVSMTDEFMDRLRKTPDAPHLVRDPHSKKVAALRKSTGRAVYGEIPPEKVGEFLTVRELWDRITTRAWNTGEPGLIFIDEVNRHNQTPHIFEMRATNPCGEQPLGPYEACNLGSVNLERFYRPAVRGSLKERIDWDKLKNVVRTCIRFLDDVVEVNNYPTKEIDDACRSNRKVGLGVMGWADLLFQLGIKYDSEEALQLARDVGSFIQKTSWEIGAELAEQRGCFKNWKGSTWDTKHKIKARNAHYVTIAPTGTISIIAGCSGGIEPIFSLAFMRQVLDGKTLSEVNPIFQQALKDSVKSDHDIEKAIDHAASKGTVQDCDLIPAGVREIYRTARDIAPEWHVRMQAAWQEHTDAAVSKTINLPPDCDVATVEAAYMLAYETKCKGITVYRDGSRPLQPMALKGEVGKTLGDMAAGAKTAPVVVAVPTGPMRPISLPEIMPCVRVRQFTPFGNMHVKISVEPSTGIEREVFAQLGKGGDLANSDLEAICRIVSLFLRCNGDFLLAVSQLDGIGSSLSVPSKEGRIKSLADGLAHALRKYLTAKQKFGIKGLLLGETDCAKLSDGHAMNGGNGGGGGNGSGHAAAPAVAEMPVVLKPKEMFKIKCPSCEIGTLAFQEGCVKCHGCGYSQC
ncbi:MAG: adenosylcobalamin-dependent ribonucleoside-diphosphate reductase [Planctomycetes bacterium]|nr:adenosylcobalamin-dependent ribonucleoside-diphosphate reductase [Planctomycetota bacterium]